jgi:putative DNA primase/helicase
VKGGFGMNYETNLDNPEWLSDKGVINEVLFCKEFVELYPMKYIDSKFISVDGVVTTDKISAQISDMLIPHVYTNLARKVKSLTEALKLYCHTDELKTCSDEIHVQNGILKTSGRYISRKDFCVNRFNVHYTENQQEPYIFLKFLRDMLEDEDILTLQEYLGYCLIPSTKGQSMLFIIGNGGEGKSRIGIVMKAIFGDAMIESKLHRLETDRFARANLQNKLLMIDDDMQLEALTSTGYIKNLVTAETPVDIEIKGQQSFQAKLYARFLCFGNGSPKALYDRTDGFSRRLIILTTKPIPPDRQLDRHIADRMIEEKDRIFGWMFKGLQRLISNNYCFTISEKTKLNVADMMSDNCNIIEFLKDESEVQFGEDYKASSMDLHNIYCGWCEDNALTPLKRDTFIGWLKANQNKYHIRYNCNILNRENKRVRGFQGISVVHAPNMIYGV